MRDPEGAVVDASVAVKWYVPERDHEAARALRDEYVEGAVDLFAPALFPFEVVNALRYGSQYNGERLVEAAESLSKYGIELVEFHRCGPVATVAEELDIPVYDASYLALAASNGWRLYTADERLVRDTAGSEYAESVRGIDSSNDL